MPVTIATHPLKRRGVYPGSFNPPTVAHLAIAELALKECRLDSITLAVSRRALAKESADALDRPRFSDRIQVLEAMVAGHDQLELLVTDQQLIADIAEGFDVVVFGADKWHQICDPKFYGNNAATRDAAVARLPEVALIPRPPFPTDGIATLALTPELAEQIATVSSTEARAGNQALMVPEAQAFDQKTGAWTDPERYESSLPSS